MCSLIQELSDLRLTDTKKSKTLGAGQSPRMTAHGRERVQFLQTITSSLFEPGLQRSSLVEETCNRRIRSVTGDINKLEAFGEILFF